MISFFNELASLKKFSGTGYNVKDVLKLLCTHLEKYFLLLNIQLDPLKLKKGVVTNIENLLI